MKSGSKPLISNAPQLLIEHVLMFSGYHMSSCCGLGGQKAPYPGDSRGGAP